MEMSLYWSGLSACHTALMLRLLRLLAVPVIGFFRSRRDLLLENLALRQQLAVLKRRHSRPRLAATDRLFWVILRRFWSRWRHALILVQPDTVVRWHRAGFKLYWTWLSRHRVRAGRSSRPREFHPEPLTGPDVSLSTHPARATNLKATAFRPNMRAHPVASWPDSDVGDPPPSLHDHYNRFITTTGQSVPDRCIGTFGLMGSPLAPFPLTPPIRFSSSV